MRNVEVLELWLEFGHWNLTAVRKNKKENDTNKVRQWIPLAMKEKRYQMLQAGKKKLAFYLRLQCQ